MDNNKPQVRFKGFDEDLQSIQLGAISVIGDIDHRMPQTVSDGIPYLMTGDFIGLNDLDFENAKLVSIEDYNQLSKKIKPELGDILFARYASIGEVRYVETNKNFLISYSCAIIKKSDSIFEKYLYYYLQNNKIQNQIELEINTGSQRNIGIDSIRKLTFQLPKETEQKEISTFFDNLDKLISEHQQKHAKLKALNKAMLSKMFPQQGQTVPEIRFRGFTENWEKSSIENFADRYDNLRIPIKANKRVKGLTPYYGANGIQDYVEGYTHDGEFILIAEDGANDLINYPIQYTNGKIWVNNHAHVLQAKNDIGNNLFLKYVISQTNIEPFLVGGGRAKLNAETMMKIGVWITKDLNEQKKIADYFFNIENLIDNLEIQIEKFNNIKKAFLAKMFI